MNIKRLLFPIWYTFKSINYSEEDRRLEETLRLVEELKDMPPMTAKEIQQYINNKSKV